MIATRTIPCGELHAPVEGSPRCYRGEPHFAAGACGACAHYTPGLTLSERTRCEVWTRVMGYHRPVAQFNPGKQSEHAERTLFVERGR